MQTSLRSLAVALATAFVLPSQALACPFCSAPSLTLSEQTDQSDVALFAEWTGSTKDEVDDGEDKASTTYVVKKVLKGPFKEGQTIKQAGYQPGEKGEAYLLTGLGADVVQWDIPVAFSEAAFEYLSKAPKPQTADGEKVPYQERLPYFVQFLESPDETSANDAYGEFANAPYEEIAAIAKHLPSDRLRKWVLNPETPPARLGLYGLLLGLSGTDDDAQAMEELIAKPTADFRIGLDGVMSGYLLLKKEPGLDLVQELKLENEHLMGKDGKPLLDDAGEKVPVPFSETYAAMQAVRFMWTYGENRIEPERLRAALRTLLDRPELADLVIVDLARWKDWTILDKLFDLYDAEAYQVPGIKRAIIRFFLAATKDLPEGVTAADAEKLPEHYKKAENYLKTIEQKDPETVASVRQFDGLINGF